MHDPFKTQLAKRFVLFCCTSFLKRYLLGHLHRLRTFSNIVVCCEAFITYIPLHPLGQKNQKHIDDSEWHTKEDGESTCRRKESCHTTSTFMSFIPLHFGIASWNRSSLSFLHVQQENQEKSELVIQSTIRRTKKEQLVEEKNAIAQHQHQDQRVRLCIYRTQFWIRSVISMVLANILNAYSRKTKKKARWFKMPYGGRRRRNSLRRREPSCNRYVCA